MKKIYLALIFLSALPILPATAATTQPHLSRDALDAFCGEYALENDDVLRIFRRDNRLLAQSRHGEIAEISATSNARFISTNKLITLEFLQHENGLVSAVTMSTRKRSGTGS